MVARGLILLMLAMMQPDIPEWQSKNRKLILVYRMFLSAVEMHLLGSP
jgi:hypothetical protein